METNKENNELNDNLCRLNQIIGLIGEIRDIYEVQSEDEAYDILTRSCLLLSNIILFNMEDKHISDKYCEDLINYYNHLSAAHAIAKFIYNADATSIVSSLKVSINIMYNKLMRYFNSISLEEILLAPPIEIKFVSGIDYSNIALVKDIVNFLWESLGLNPQAKDILSKNIAVFVSSLQIALEFQKDSDYYSDLIIIDAAAKSYIHECYIETVRSLLKLKADSLRIKKSDIDTEKLKDKLVNAINELYRLLSPKARMPIALDGDVFQSLAVIATEIMKSRIDEIDTDKAPELIETINSFVKKSKSKNITV